MSDVKHQDLTNLIRIGEGLLDILDVVPTRRHRGLEPAGDLFGYVLRFPYEQSAQSALTDHVHDLMVAKCERMCKRFAK